MGESSGASTGVDVEAISPRAWRLLRVAAGYEQRAVERELDDVIQAHLSMLRTTAGGSRPTGGASCSISTPRSRPTGRCVRWSRRSDHGPAPSTTFHTASDYGNTIQRDR
jgi:hypothetical protein